MKKLSAPASPEERIAELQEARVKRSLSSFITHDERHVLRTDLKILEEMVLEIEPYLMSESLHWPLTKINRPKLTIGGYLMRQQRLTALCDLLRPKELARLEAIIKHFNLALDGRLVRFERRAHRELRICLGEWIGYLRCLIMYKGSKIAATKIANYAREVGYRVVITALIDELERPIYQLDRRIPEEVLTLDYSLRNRWQEGEFVWAPVWELAYPKYKYWCLYGKPK